jgi:hypothetical protein
MIKRLDIPTNILMIPEKNGKNIISLYLLDLFNDKRNKIINETHTKTSI